MFGINSNQELNGTDIYNRLSGTNQLLRLLKKFPHKKWTWADLSYNPCISWEILYKKICSRDGQFWDWFYISRNKIVTWEIVQKYPHLPWSYYGLSLNKNITLDIVLQNPEKPWCPGYLLRNPSIRYEELLKSHIGGVLRANYRTNIFHQICYNPNVTVEDVLKLTPSEQDHLDWEILGYNENIPWEMVVRNLHEHSIDTFSGLSSNVPFKVVRDNPHLPWCMYTLSQNYRVTWDDVEGKGIDWNYVELASNCSISWKIIKQKFVLYPTKDEKVNVLFENSRGRDATIKRFHKSSSKTHAKKLWESANKNPNLTFTIIKKNIQIPWNWESISTNRFAENPEVRKRHIRSLTMKRKRLTGGSNFVNMY